MIGPLRFVGASQVGALCFCVSLLAFGGGCRTAPARRLPPAQQSANTPAVVPCKTRYVHEPMAHPTTCEKINPVWWFGNIDDPVPPESYRPEDKHRLRKWYFRNSLHNFMFYVIGIADEKFVRVGRCPEKVFHPEGGWNWAVCKYKWLRLPFISYQRGGFKFYCGWRNHGNFGIKLNF